jgi:hypothetical protein
MARQIYQLRIDLVGTEPPVWRRVLVPAGYTLDRVSRTIQLAFGWQGVHLHSFEIGGRQFGEPDPLGELELQDELDVRLDSVAAAGARFSYVYDFGDWWEHEITVENVVPAHPDDRHPTCVAGDRAGPPEDVGGPEGYAEILAILSNPDRPDGTGVREWLTDFDPNRFEPGRISALLRRMT